MALEIRGRVSHILPQASGVSAAGREWKKQDFVIETQEQFPRSVCFTLFGDDKVGMLASVEIGTEVNVFFNLESREYQGRWYSNVNAWKIEKAEGAPTGSVPPPELNQPANDGAPSADDLPF